MEAVTSPMLVVGYGEWDIDGEPALRADGSHVEFVTLLDTETNDSYQWSLAAEVNGDRPDELERCALEVSMRTRERNGRKKLAVTVLGFRAPVAS